MTQKCIQWKLNLSLHLISSWERTLQSNNCDLQFLMYQFNDYICPLLYANSRLLCMLFCPLSFMCKLFSVMQVDLTHFSSYTDFQHISVPIIIYLLSSLLMPPLFYGGFPSTTQWMWSHCILLIILPLHFLLSKLFGFLSTIYFLELKFLLFPRPVSYLDKLITCHTFYYLWMTWESVSPIPMSFSHDPQIFPLHLWLLHINKAKSFIIFFFLMCTIF